MIKVAFADDHQVFLDGLQSLVQQNEMIETVGTANNGQELLSLLEQNEVDVAVIDINMPVMNGIAVTKEIVQRFPKNKVKVLILSMYEDCRHVEQVIDAGAHGYIRKGANTQEVMDGIKALHNGASLHIGEGVQYPCPPKLFSLTKTEERVLRYLTQGLAAPEIAEKMFISVNTVNTHKRNMMGKLGFNNVQQLVRYGMENGYDEL